jgi:hypothetical protein
MTFSFRKVRKFTQILNPTQIANIASAPTKAEIQLTMMEDELKTGRSTGLVAWFSMGLKIEETQ